MSPFIKIVRLCNITPNECENKQQLVSYNIQNSYDIHKNTISPTKIWQVARSFTFNNASTPLSRRNTLLIVGSVKILPIFLDKNDENEYHYSIFRPCIEVLNHVWIIFYLHTCRELLRIKLMNLFHGFHFGMITLFTELIVV